MDTMTGLGKFFGELSSFYWWLSVFAVGILINIVSAYLKPQLDDIMSFLFSHWKNRSTQKKAEYERVLELYSRDQVLISFVSTDSVRGLLNAFIYMFLSFTGAFLSFGHRLIFSGTNFSDHFTLIATIVCAIISFWDLGHAAKANLFLGDIKKRRLKLASSPPS